MVPQTDCLNDKPNNDVEDQTQTPEVTLSEGTAAGDNERGSPRSIGSIACDVIRVIMRQYSFPLMIMIAILVAWLYPPLGGEYVQPEITASWLAVAVIFLFSGIAIKTEDFSSAIRNVYLNGFIQVYNFCFVSVTVYAVCKGLQAGSVLNESLVTGMVICASLPISINTAIVLTALADGDNAAAVLNTCLSNCIGVFVSPALIVLYVGKPGNVSLGEVFYKLILRVIVPLFVGQLLQYFVKAVREEYHRRKHIYKHVSELCLVFIVYCVFCENFGSDNPGAPIGDIFIMIAFQFCLMSLMHTVAWFCLRFLFPSSPRQRVCGFYACVHKTVSLGIPLINSMYSESPNLALYSLPILVWHPMQLVLGSLIAPRLKKFVESELERLKCGDEVSADSEDDEEASKSRSEHLSGDLTERASSEAVPSGVGDGSAR